MPLTTRTRPAIAIMIAAGTVHVIRSAPLDATVFYAAALVVSVETRWLR